MNCTIYILALTPSHIPLGPVTSHPPRQTHIHSHTLSLSLTTRATILCHAYTLLYIPPYTSSIHPFSFSESSVLVSPPPHPPPPAPTHIHPHTHLATHHSLSHVHLARPLQTFSTHFFYSYSPPPNPPPHPPPHPTPPQILRPRLPSSLNPLHTHTHFLARQPFFVSHTPSNT